MKRARATFTVKIKVDLGVYETEEKAREAANMVVNHTGLTMIALPYGSLTITDSIVEMPYFNVFDTP